MRTKNRKTDSKIYIHSVFNFLSCTFDDSFTSVFVLACNLNLGSLLVDHSKFDSFLVEFTFNDSVSVAGRQMDIIWIKLAWLYNFLHFDNTSFACTSYVWIEITSSFSENYVSKSVGFPTLYDREISCYRLF